MIELEPWPALLARRSRWRWIGAHFVVASKQTSVRTALRKISAREIRPAQIGGRQINAGHVGTSEVRIPQISTLVSTATETDQFSARRVLVNVATWTVLGG